MKSSRTGSDFSALLRCKGESPLLIDKKKPGRPNPNGSKLMFLLGHTPKSFQTLYFEISSTGKPMAWGFLTLEKHLAAMLRSDTGKLYRLMEKVLRGRKCDMNYSPDN